MTWKNFAIVLMVVTAWLGWRDCRRPAVKRATPAECEKLASSSSTSSSSSRHPASDEVDEEQAPAARPPSDGMTVRGFHVPGWAMRLLPQPGENLLAYRDRIVPLAQMAIAPHRSRVAKGRDDFAAVAHLDARQKAELDAAVQDAATQIQDRLLGAALGGEFSPQSFKPMTGVAIAREVLEIVERADQRFTGTLREDQRAALARHPFDFGDYLVFATRWEDALGYTDK